MIKEREIKSRTYTIYQELQKVDIIQRSDRPLSFNRAYCSKKASKFDKGYFIKEP